MNEKAPGHENDLEEPTPPGGPLRRDAPAGATTPGEGAIDPGPDVQRVTREPGRNPALDEGDHVPGQERSEASKQEQVEAALQEENAETSLDQPSQ